jgi:hypothetical protein
MNRQTGHFRVRTTTGQIVEIIEYTDFIRVDTFEGSGEIEGLKSLETAAGLAVNKLGPDEVEILHPAGSILAQRV